MCDNAIWSVAPVGNINIAIKFICFQVPKKMIWQFRPTTSVFILSSRGYGYFQFLFHFGLSSHFCLVFINELVTCWSQSTKLLYVRPGYSTWMGDRLRVGKPSWYVTSHPGQLSLAIPPWIDTMSTSESWAVNKHRTMH